MTRLQMENQTAVPADVGRSAYPTMKTVLALLLLVSAGCEGTRDGTFAFEAQTAERFGRNLGAVQSVEFATDSEVNSAVALIDWSTGKTRACVSIVPFGHEKDSASFQFQHDLKSESVHITAVWKSTEGDEQIATVLDQNSVLGIVRAYTKGEDLSELANWRRFGGSLPVQSAEAEP